MAAPLIGGWYIIDTKLPLPPGRDGPFRVGFMLNDGAPRTASEFALNLDSAVEKQNDENGTIVTQSGKALTEMASENVSNFLSFFLTVSGKK